MIQDSKKYFLACRLTPEFHQALTDYALRIRIQGIRWIRPENYHVTVCYVGFHPEEKIKEYFSALRRILTASQSFSLPWKGIERVPEGNPRMIWARFSVTPEFQALVESIQSILRPIVPSEVIKRRVLPHVNLAYLKEPFLIDDRRLPQIKELDGKKLAVTECVLFHSHSTHEGSVYTAVERFFLGSSA